jgi:hypothetical protein
MSEDSTTPPEWAMLELNGELIPPLEIGSNGDENDENSLLRENQVELGSLHFTNDVSTLLSWIFSCVSFDIVVG